MIRRFLIPVFSRSLPSKSASHFFPSVDAFRSRSTSSLYPVFMMLPSRTEIGGSSLMEDFKSAHRSSRQSKCSRIPVASSPFKSSSSVLIGGSISKELQKAIISRGLAVWYVILVIRRSRSYIGPKYSRNSSRVISTSSRFLREELSMIIYFPMEYGRSSRILERVFFCVSYRYFSNAAEAITPQS